MYEISFTKNAEKQFKKLDFVTQERIVSVLERVKNQPEMHIKKLVGQPGYRLRVGDYRVIMDIDGRRLIILVLYVGHRRTVYKN